MDDRGRRVPLTDFVARVLNRHIVANTRVPRRNNRPPASCALVPAAAQHDDWQRACSNGSRQSSLCGPDHFLMKNDVEQLAVRVSGEFMEMPGLRLTMSQAQRLWCIDGETCAEVVALLVARSILRRQADTITSIR
jgi:hypothetical protein